MFGGDDVEAFSSFAQALPVHCCSLGPCAPGVTAGLPERLEAQLEQAAQVLVLSHFALGEVEMDSALALVEHLAEGAEGEA